MATSTQTFNCNLSEVAEKIVERLNEMHPERDFQLSQDVHEHHITNDYQIEVIEYDNEAEESFNHQISISAYGELLLADLSLSY